MDTTKLRPLPNGKGSFGTCYIVDDKTLYKELQYNKFINLKTIKKLKGIKNDSIVFPEKIYEYDDHFGYEMPYIKKPNLTSLEFNVSVENIVNSLDKAYDDIDKVSEENEVTLMDVSSSNVLYKDSFTLCDFDFYRIHEKQRNIKLFNQFQFTGCIKNYVLGNSKTRKCTEKLIQQNKKLKNLLEQRNEGNDRQVIKEFLIEYKKYISEHAGYKIDNLSQLQQYITKNVK